MCNNLLANFGDMFKNLWNSLGFNSGSFASTWPNYVMLLISFVLMYLAIVKKFEPLLLLPIAFGMFLINLPGAYNVVWGTYPDPVEIIDTTQLTQYLSAEQYAEMVALNIDWTTLTEAEFSQLALPETFKFIDGSV